MSLTGSEGCPGAEGASLGMAESKDPRGPCLPLAGALHVSALVLIHTHFWVLLQPEPQSQDLRERLRKSPILCLKTHPGLEYPQWEQQTMLRASGAGCQGITLVGTATFGGRPPPLG